MGGIATDARGRTSVPGLWAVGEVAGTGLHGANRLASNSLLEAVVLGARAAADIKALIPAERAGHFVVPKRVSGPTPLKPAKRAELISRLRAIMTLHVGVVRNAKSLKLALQALDTIATEGKEDPLLANMVLTARLITTAALQRKESRGGHFRDDYPQANPALAVRTFITLADLTNRAGAGGHLASAAAANANCTP
jgi:L-aspartate oxidase